MRDGRGGDLPKHCTVHKPGSQGNWWPGIALTGPCVGSRNVSSGGANGCCALSDSVPYAAFWTFTPAGDSANLVEGMEGGDGAGVCTFLPYVKGVKPHKASGSISGRADPRLKASDFVELYDKSCLNGWTMGNIATTPSEMTKFYHALSVAGTVLTPSSLRQMRDWKKLTTGFAPGTPYGLGLMQGQIALPLKGVKRCNGLIACKCWLFRGCYFYSTTEGHAGLDYGSGMPLIGHVTQLNFTFAVAINVGEQIVGMNTSLGILENFDVFGILYCRMFDVFVHAQLPSYPAFKC